MANPLATLTPTYAKSVSTDNIKDMDVGEAKELAETNKDKDNGIGVAKWKKTLKSQGSSRLSIVPIMEPRTMYVTAYGKNLSTLASKKTRTKIKEAKARTKTLRTKTKEMGTCKEKTKNTKRKAKQKEETKEAKAKKKEVANLKEELCRGASAWRT